MKSSYTSPKLLILPARRKLCLVIELKSGELAENFESENSSNFMSFLNPLLNYTARAALLSSYSEANPQVRIATRLLNLVNFNVLKLQIDELLYDIQSWVGSFACLQLTHKQQSETFEWNIALKFQYSSEIHLKCRIQNDSHNQVVTIMRQSAKTTFYASTLAELEHIILQNIKKSVLDTIYVEAICVFGKNRVFSLDGGHFGISSDKHSLNLFLLPNLELQFNVLVFHEIKLKFHSKKGLVSSVL
jgi:hypothetical protein